MQRGTQAVKEAVEHGAAPGPGDQSGPSGGRGATPRPLRADAARNRRHILEAAEQLFATAGVLAQVDEIAERAGVGVGTFYRHFPTKELLLEAIFRARLEDLAARCAAAASAEDPGEAFFSFLHGFADLASRKRDLFEALGAAGVDVKERCAPEFAALHEALRELLARAQQVGAVREDVTADEVIGLVSGSCHAAHPGSGCEEVQRLVGIVCDGLRTPGG